MNQHIEQEHAEPQTHPLFVERERLMNEVAAASQQILDMEESFEKNLRMAKGALQNYLNHLKNVSAQIDQLMQQDQAAREAIAQKMDEEERRSR